MPSKTSSSQADVLTAPSQYTPTTSLGRFQMSTHSQSNRSRVVMMGVAAGEAMAPTISGEPYTKMIENYMDKDS